MDIIISIEWTFTSLNVHLLMTEISRIYTYRTDSIRNQNDIALVVNSIVEGDYKKAIDYFKERYSLLHCGITLSLGPTLRKKLKEKRGEQN